MEKKRSLHIHTRGSRKTSVALVRLETKGKGELIVNGKPYNEYFPTDSLQRLFLDALEKAGHVKDLNIFVKVKGGGKVGQAEASRHGMARALIELNPDLRPMLKAEGFLKRDPRVKERKKPGLRRARRAPQWSKR